MKFSNHCITTAITCFDLKNPLSLKKLTRNTSIGFGALPSFVSSTINHVAAEEIDNVHIIVWNQSDNIETIRERILYKAIHSTWPYVFVFAPPEVNLNIVKAIDCNDITIYQRCKNESVKLYEVYFADNSYQAAQISPKHLYC